MRAHEFGFLPPEMVENLLEMQFRARESQYAASFPEAESYIVLWDGVEAGRFLFDRSPGGVHIVDIALLPEFRGLGVGTALLRGLLEGAGPVTLQVRPDNPARRLYARLGFAVVSESEMDCEMRFGG